jgi:hypothetical protein
LESRRLAALVSVLRGSNAWTAGKRFTESTAALAGMRIGLETAERVVNMLVEGMSISAAARKRLSIVSLTAPCRSRISAH